MFSSFLFQSLAGKEKKKKNKAAFFLHSDSGASMHMITKKDLNSTELETVTTSTTVITANGEVQTHEEATVFYIRELEKFLTMKVLENTPAVYRQERFAMNMDIHMSGSTVKNHISSKTGFGYPATRRTSFLLWFLVYQRVLPQACPLPLNLHQFQRKFQDRRVIVEHLLQAYLHHLQ